MTLSLVKPGGFREGSAVLTRDELISHMLTIAEAAQPGAKVIAAFRKDQARLENVFIKELEGAFDDLGALLAAVTAGQGGILWEASAGERARILAILAAAKLRDWTKKVLQPLFEKHWKRVLDTTLMTLKREDVPVTMRSKLESKLLKEGGKRVGLLDISGDTKESLFRVLDQGRGRGLNPRDVAKLIEGEVPKGRFVNAGSKYRAQLIARTETLHAQRTCSLAMYRESPEIKKVIAFDGDYDDECIARNGTEYTFDEADVENAITHPNCVLAFAPVV